jgi:integrase
LGVNDLDIQKIMRHSHVDVTRTRYIKVSDTAKSDAMAKLRAVLGKHQKPTRRRRKSVKS